MNVSLPKQVLWLLDIFAQHHYDLYLVGGCVRDAYLHRPIHDYDFTTNATPQEMLEFLAHTDCKIIPTGIKHGTLTILYQEEAMEVTTYRCEQTYEGHRRPKTVQFSRSLEADLARRDFTMNAMAYHPSVGLIDPFHGQQDLDASIIRCVGNSEDRFEEDALRMLRALRFSFQLQFPLENACFAAIKEKAHLLAYISKERIREEFDLMLLSDGEQLLSTLRNAQVLPYMIPALTQIYHISQECKWHIYDVFTHTDTALNHTKGYSLCEKLAIVFHDVGKAHCKSIDEHGHAHFYGHPKVSAEIAQRALRQMTYANKVMEQVVTLITYHDTFLRPQRKMLRRFLAKLNMDYAQAYAILRVQYADDCGKNLIHAQEKLDTIEECVQLLQEMEKEEPSLQRRDLAINGNDLIALGYEGKQIGTLLSWCYDKVIEHPESNDKATLLHMIKEIPRD